MQERLYDYLEITDLKDMLNKTKKLYENNIAYKIKQDGKYKTFNHSEVRNMIDNLGTKLIDMGLQYKRIAVIGENRYEWEIAYLSIVCGLAKIGNQNFTIIAEQKGRTTRENIERNFGMPNPESYRKAIRFMKQAEKFNRPVITFIDTKGAYPGIGAEERGQRRGNSKVYV